MEGEQEIDLKEFRRWTWERYGEGWALIQGRTPMTQGSCRLWVADQEFDETGAALRDKIAALLNSEENI